MEKEIRTILGIDLGRMSGFLGIKEAIIKICSDKNFEVVCLDDDRKWSFLMPIDNAGREKINTYYSVVKAELQSNQKAFMVKLVMNGEGVFNGAASSQEENLHATGKLLFGRWVRSQIDYVLGYIDDVESLYFIPDKQE